MLKSRTSYPHSPQAVDERPENQRKRKNSQKMNPLKVRKYFNIGEQKKESPT